jgi:hypothetical protein
MVSCLGISSNQPLSVAVINICTVFVKCHFDQNNDAGSGLLLRNGISMTLQSYDPPQLDQLSLRLLDVVCTLRRMATATRSSGLEKIVLHDKKPLEWIARLEAWAEISAARAETAALRQRVRGGARRASPKP